MSPCLTESKIQPPKSKIDIAPGLKSLRQRLFSISPEEATFARRGFQGRNAKTQERLEQVGRIFLQGYNAAIAHNHPESLIPQLNAIEAEWRGFAFEGAAMGLALLDYLTPWKQNRIPSFLAGAGADHAYMVYVGIGWLLARIPFGVQRYLQRGGFMQVIGESQNWLVKPAPRQSQIQNLKSEIPNLKSIDPLLGWLAIDGYGFHQGYFHWHRYVEKQAIPSRFSDYALRVFDQGLGRSLWFVKGGDVRRIAATVGGFHPRRQADLWSGIGLACTYAGGADFFGLEMLQTAAGSDWPHLAQGAAFAAKARLRANNLTLHTKIACQVLCGMSAETAAEITDIALQNLPTDAALPAYEIWRQRIQEQFSCLV